MDLGRPIEELTKKVIMMSIVMFEGDVIIMSIINSYKLTFRLWIYKLKSKRTKGKEKQKILNLQLIFSIIKNLLWNLHGTHLCQYRSFIFKSVTKKQLSCFVVR